MKVTTKGGTLTMTTGEFAERTGVDYQTAMGFLRFLKAAGSVTEVGTRPAVGGKGKPSTLLAIPVEVIFELSVGIVRVPQVEDAVPKAEVA